MTVVALAGVICAAPHLDHQSPGPGSATPPRLHSRRDRPHPVAWIVPIPASATAPERALGVGATIDVHAGDAALYLWHLGEQGGTSPFYAAAVFARQPRFRRGYRLITKKTTAPSRSRVRQNRDHRRPTARGPYRGRTPSAFPHIDHS